MGVSDLITSLLENAYLIFYHPLPLNHAEFCNSNDGILKRCFVRKDFRVYGVRKMPT